MNVVPSFQLLDTSPAVDVSDADYRRFLKWPAGRELTVEAAELCRSSRELLAREAKPWTFLRAVPCEITGAKLSLGVTEFTTPRLSSRWKRERVETVVVFAVSAGLALEESAAAAWEQGRPDEAFFLDALGSAVVEQLAASCERQACVWAEDRACDALSRSAPGYAGWSLSQQIDLFGLIRTSLPAWFAEPFSILPSGMLLPRKAMLGVVPLAPKVPGRRRIRPSTACQTCALLPCSYRKNGDGSGEQSENQSSTRFQTRPANTTQTDRP